MELPFVGCITVLVSVGFEGNGDESDPRNVTDPDGDPVSDALPRVGELGGSAAVLVFVVDVDSDEMDEEVLVDV